MLHHQTKKKAVTKYGKLLSEGKSREEVEALLIEEEYTSEEIAEIFTAIDAPAPQKAASAKEQKVSSPNDALDLSEFNYKALKGDSFKKYVELVGDRSFIEIVDGEAVPVRGKLLENDSYDFEQFKAKPIRRPRYAGVDGSPMDYIGLEIINDTPVHTSRMTIKNVLEMNAQILNHHSIAGHGKYYLLKKK